MSKQAAKFTADTPADLLVHVVQVRRKTVINTDPLRRCYDGQFFSPETVWTTWADLCPFQRKEDAEASAAGWRQINPHQEYRVAQKRWGDLFQMEVRRA